MKEQNETNEIDLIALARIVWSKRKKIFFISIWGLLFGVIVSLSIPKEYTSKLKVAPEGAAKNISPTSGLAAMMGVNISGNGAEGVNENLYPEIISSTPFLLAFADIEVTYKNKQIPMSEYILEHQRRPWWSYIMAFPGQVAEWIMNIGAEKIDTLTIKNSPTIQYAFANNLSNKIILENDSKKGIIEITSTFQDPQIAKMVLDTLVVNLGTYMNNYRTARTRSNLESNLKMLKEAQEKYYETDELYAQSQDKNQNLISKSASLKLDRLQNERNLAYQVYQQLAMQVETDKVKLQDQKTIVTIIEPVSTPTYPSAPRKVLIIVAFTCLAAFIATGIIIVKTIYKTQTTVE